MKAGGAKRLNEPISWRSNSLIPIGDFSFTLMKSSLIQVDFKHVGQLANEFVDSLAKQGVDRSPFIVISL